MIKYLKVVGNRIYKARALCGFDRKTLVAHTGISDVHIFNIESGIKSHRINLEQISTIARILNVSLPYILSLSTNNEDVVVAEANYDYGIISKLPKRFEFMRRVHSYSYSSLAVGLSISETKYSYFQDGTQPIQLTMFYALCNFYSVSAEDMLIAKFDANKVVEKLNL